jgi:DNA-binding transcriptional LysR family regulator
MVGVSDRRPIRWGGTVTDNVELRHLRGFIAVADELSFSRAARKLHMVQQSLSSQVRQLEEELGVQLFHRTTRKVELSDAGQVLLTHARAVLSLVNAACEQTRRAGEGDSGRLVVAYTPTLASETLPRLVSELHSRHPGLSLQMCEMWQTESMEAVTSGRVDVGMARCPEIPDELASIQIRHEPIGVVLGTGHPLADMTSLRVNDLAQMTLAIWPRLFSPGFYDQIVNPFRSWGFRGKIQEFEYLTSSVFNSDPAAREEIAAGRAFSVAFATQFDPIPEGFVWRELEPPIFIPVTVFWRQGAGEATQRFLAIALEVSKQERWLDTLIRRRLPAGPGTRC